MTRTQRFLVALLVLLVLVLGYMFWKEKQSKEEVYIPDVVGTAPAVAQRPVAFVDATVNDDDAKLQLATICTLQSDGTAILISAQVALAKGQDAFRKKKITEAQLDRLIADAKPLPPHAVIAEVPQSVLKKGVTCGDWRRQRNAQLVLGAQRYTPPGS